MRFRSLDRAYAVLFRARRRQMMGWSAAEMAPAFMRERPLLYIGNGRRVVPEFDTKAWALWLERPCNRRVRSTRIGGIRIFTSFIGCGHGPSVSGLPFLWETMVFAQGVPGAEEINYNQQRYMSREEAVMGHEEVVAEVRQFLAERAQA